MLNVPVLKPTWASENLQDFGLVAHQMSSGIVSSQQYQLWVIVTHAETTKLLEKPI